MEDKKKIAAIGSKEFTVGFELAGIKDTYGKENYQEKIEELLSSDNLGILIVNKEDLSQLRKRTRQEIDTSVNPVVVPLSKEAKSARLQEKIKKAIGADITS